MTLFKSLHPLILNTVFVCLVIVVHESLVCPEQLNCCSSEKSFRSQKFLVFQHHLCIWTLSYNDYDFEIHLICNYYRRFKRSPDSNIVSAQIQPTSDLCEIHAGHIWADTACCLGHWWFNRKKCILFEFEDQGKCNLFCLLGTCKYLL